MLVSYGVRVKDPARFVEALDTVRISAIGEGSNRGLRVTRAQEHTLHEYAHAVTLGVRLRPGVRGPGISAAIEVALRGRNERENEERTLAAELVVLDALGALDDSHDFLEAIGEQLVADVDTHVTMRLERSSTLALARSDARRVIARIRQHARDY